MTENKLVINSKDKEWLTSKEASAIWGCSPINIVQNSRKFKENLRDEVEGFGRGKVFKISKDGLFVLRNIVDGNKWKSPTVSKASIAKKAIESGKGFDLDKMLQISANILQATSNMAASINKIETDQKQLAQKVETLEKELDKPLPVSSLHRQFLNDRVRLYALKQSMDFPVIWSHLNKHVGRGGVSFYDFSDFKKAERMLKSMYEQAGMDW